MTSEIPTKPILKVETVEEFVANGGKITKCERGESGHDTTQRAWDIKRSWKRKQNIDSSLKSIVESDSNSLNEPIMPTPPGARKWRKRDGGNTP